MRLLKNAKLKIVDGFDINFNFKNRDHFILNFYNEEKSFI